MKLALHFIFTILLMLIFPNIASAQNANDLGIGTIDTPPGVEQYNSAAGADIGIIYFLSNLIKVFAVVAGIWVLFNITLAGFTYIGSSGDSSAHEKVRAQITNSVIGLIFIVLSYTIGGLIGLIFFGDPTFILEPKL